MARGAAGWNLAGAMLAAIVTVAGCQSRAPAAEDSDAHRIERCVGISDATAQCHRLSVYENQTTRRGKTISLRIVVLPATTRDKASDAVVYLAGGPGQAATELLGDTSFEIDGVRQHRDLIYADQRGTGGSHPLLCQFYGPPDNPQTYFDAFLPIEKVRACRESLERDADLAQYTTSASVEDLEEIRIALGYERLTLVGGSYGTRLAMEYVRRYEPRVRAVVLEGPVTPANHVPEHFGQLAARALDGLLDECLADAECARAFPAIREETRQVFDRLRQRPVTATVAHPSFSDRSRESSDRSRESPDRSRESPDRSRERPGRSREGGRPGTVTLTRDHVAEAIRYLMYSSAGASRVPLYLHDAFNGDFSPIASFLIRWRARGTFDGLYLSITCAEDVPLVSAGAAETDDPTFLGGYRVRQQRAACAVWPRGTRPPSSDEPVRSSVPTLITSGTLDPVTPPENGDALARTLTRSLHLRAPSGGHSLYGLQGLGCLDSLKRDFVERGEVVGLDQACMGGIARPGFATTR